MKWIRLFESYDKDVKLAKANEIFGIWLMIKIFSRGFLKKEEYIDFILPGYTTTITNYFTAGDKKVISIKMNSFNKFDGGQERLDGRWVEGAISVSKPYRSRMIREFLTKCGFKNPDDREYWTWYEQALKKIYALPTNRYTHIVVNTMYD